jgi:SAM-dependent methyltransferase
MYSKLADVYDQMYHFKDYVRESEYVAAAIRSRNPSAKTLLETACGTGRFLQHLRNEFSVEGLDLSTEMLERAARVVPGIALHAADMTSFSLGRPFDVVCCLFRSIAHCRTPERFAAAVRAMASHLAPGGLLVIEPFFTPETFWDDNIVLNEYQDEKLKLSWMYVGKRHGNEVRLDIHCLVGTREGVTHFVEAVDLGLFTPQQYADAFAAAGLEMFYEPQGPSGVGLYIARKPAA